MKGGISSFSARTTYLGIYPVPRQSEGPSRWLHLAAGNRQHKQEYELNRCLNFRNCCWKLDKIFLFCQQMVEN